MLKKVKTVTLSVLEFVYRNTWLWKAEANVSGFLYHIPPYLSKKYF